MIEAALRDVYDPNVHIRLSDNSDAPAEGFLFAKESPPPVGEDLTNICTYAYAGGEGEVEVQCTHDAGPRLCIDVVDSGVAFDPLSVPPP